LRTTYFSTLLALALVLAVISPCLGSGPIEILYFHRPPLYVEQNDKEPKGSLIDLTRDLFQSAGIDHRFVAMPSKRILDTMERGGNYCSTGWFKKANREEYAVFSRAVYRDKPLVLLLNKDKATSMPSEPTLAQAMSSGLTLGVISGFSYGVWADEIIQRVKPKKEMVTTSQENLFNMLALGRCDMMLLGLEEAQWVTRNYESTFDRVVIEKIQDAPMGNLRYLIFSRQVDPMIVKKINQVILQKGLPRP
jgi:polar amino acid transport system substrate-binding protein